jgi:hypothetical protein
MYLSRQAVILCPHGGRLIPDRRHYIKIGKQKVLTRQSIIDGKIVNCPNNCENVTELISGYESGAPNSPLLMNLEFLTDGTPPGRGMVLMESKLKTNHKARTILYTSLVWLLIGLASVLTTIFVYDSNFAEYQRHSQESLDKCSDDLKSLKEQNEKFRQQVEKKQ